MRRREFLRGLCTAAAAAAAAVPAMTLGGQRDLVGLAGLEFAPLASGAMPRQWHPPLLTKEMIREAIAIMRACQSIPEAGYVVHVHPDNLPLMEGIGCEVIACA